MRRDGGARAGRAATRADPVSRAAAEEAAAQRAFPASEVTAAQTAGSAAAFARSRSAATAARRRAPSCGTRSGRRVALQPGRAQLHGRRTTSPRSRRGARWSTGRAARGVPDLDGGRRRRRLDDEARAPHQQPRLEVLVGRPRLERVRDARPGSERPVAATRCTPAPASRTPPATPSAGVRHLQVHRRRRVVEPARDERRDHEDACRRRRSRSIRRTPSVIYVATARARARHLVRLRRRRRRDGRRAAERSASTRRRTAERPGRSSGTRRPPARFAASRVEIDPLDHTTVYAAAFQLGIYRSPAGGAFQQVFAAQVPTVNIDRTMFDLTVKAGKVRIYATNGSQGPAAGLPYSALCRTDDASLLAQGSPNAALWAKKTSNSTATRTTRRSTSAPRSAGTTRTSSPPTASPTRSS